MPDGQRKNPVGESSEPQTDSGVVTKRRPFSLLRTFADHPWIGFVSALFTVLGVIASFYFYFAGQRTRNLVYYVSPARTSVLKVGQASRLHVFHDGQEIRSNVSAAQIMIWNAGRESIRPEHILRRVEIATHPPVPILEATIRRRSREICEFGVQTSDVGDGRIPVTWRILEQNDGAVIQLIYAGPLDTQIEVQGVVEGQRRPTRLEPVQDISESQGKTPGPRTSYLAMAIMSLVFCGFIVAAFGRDFRGAQVPSPLKVAVVVLVTACGIASLYFFWKVLTAFSLPLDF